MDSTLARDQRTFLTTSRAGAPVIRAAWLVGLISLAFFFSVLPVAKTPMGQISSFVPVYTAVMVICDLITAVVLFGQYAVLGNRGLLLLAGGYLFTAASTTAYALVYPGFFTPAGLFGAGPQTTSALYMFWHTGFPLVVVAYALLKAAGESVDYLAPRGRRRGLAITGTVIVVLFAVFGFTVFATWGNALIPQFLVDNVTTATGKIFLVAIWSLNFVAFGALWLRRPPSVLDVWLMFVMSVWILDLALSAILNLGRYDLGWYFGRLYGLLGASFLLVILLTEFVGNYGKLIELSHALKQANKALEDLSLQDSLTGLANRRSFDGYLSQQITAARRQQQPLALIVCDVDHFKRFNDEYGHPAGDECLKLVAAALRACCRRPADLACRYGGEEFTLVLPDTDREGARQIAELVRQSVAASTPVRVSGGIALLEPQSPVTPEDLLQAADAALYRAKHQGRNRMLEASLPSASPRSPSTP